MVSHSRTRKMMPGTAPRVCVTVCGGGGCEEQPLRCATQRQAEGAPALGSRDKHPAAHPTVRAPVSVERVLACTGAGGNLFNFPHTRNPLGLREQSGVITPASMPLQSYARPPYPGPLPRHRPRLRNSVTEKRAARLRHLAPATCMHARPYPLPRMPKFEILRAKPMQREIQIQPILRAQRTTSAGQRNKAQLFNGCACASRRSGQPILDLERASEQRGTGKGKEGERGCPRERERRCRWEERKMGKKTRRKKSTCVFALCGANRLPIPPPPPAAHMLDVCTCFCFTRTTTQQINLSHEEEKQCLSGAAVERAGRDDFEKHTQFSCHAP